MNMLGTAFFVLVVLLGLTEAYHEDLYNLPQPNPRLSEEGEYWFNNGQAHLQDMLTRTQNQNVAKNIIMFLGDGMSIPTITAAGIHKGQRDGESGEGNLLAWESFPNTGLVKTYCDNFQTPDSASTATALTAGIKTSIGVLGADSKTTFLLCQSLTNDSIVDGIATWSQQQGKRTGIVSTARITHASPAATYAHASSRHYECDDTLDLITRNNCPDFKDIATQLVEDEPGSNYQVIMGGGFAAFDSTAIDSEFDPLPGCVRKDNTSLWSQWLEEKEFLNPNSYFVQTRSELLALNANDTEYLMGLFSNSHMQYEYLKVQENLDVPTLAEMVDVALDILDKGDDGYFLFVEGGRIDHANHANNAKVALDEAIALSDAVELALSRVDTKDTLIIVTSDHSHNLNIAGFIGRGDDILGVAGTDSDRTGYTALLYANGPGYNFSVANDTVVRPDPRDENTTTYDYNQQAIFPLGSATHGGDDVAVYATGPMSHLLTGVVEQNYIAHAMAYASCVGPNQDHCNFQRRKRRET